MEIIGIVEVIFEEKQVSDRFKKREFIVNSKEEGAPYDNFIKFELTQDHCGIIDKHRVGDKVKVTFDLNGRKWISPKGEEVYFTTIKAWKIMSLEENKTENDTAAVGQETPTKEPGWLKEDDNNESLKKTTTEDDDDLPF